MAILVPDADGSPVLVRWVYADDGDELIEFALRREAITRTEEVLVFANAHPIWCMFNAAADPLVHDPPMRRFALPLGTIRVATTFQEGERNAAIVHRFRKDAGD